MANPPYPPNPGMPMGQPPMGPGPMPTGPGPMMPPGPGPMMPPGPGPAGMAPRPNVVRRGTSRVVPVVVSAGLAVGTFCGLLFGLGTGKDDESEVASVESKDKKDGTTADSSTQPSDTTQAAADPTPTPPGEGSAATAPGEGSAATAPGEGSGSTPGEGSGATAGAAAASETTPTDGPGVGSGATAAPTPAVKKATLTIELSPASIADKAKIEIDGKAIDGNTYELELPTDGKKSVKVVAKASGYKTAEQEVSVDSDLTVKLDLVKRSTGGGGGVRPPKRPSRPPGGGLIDI